MATILRSSKYVRNFAEFVNRLGSSYVKSASRRELVSQSSSAPFTLARRSLATQAAAQRSNDPSVLEASLRKLDNDVKRFGRISKAKLERVLNVLQTSKSITSNQALMVIRCCGNLIADELPESRTEVVNHLWKTLEESGVELDLSHYNALLRVYVENEYEFSPAEVLAELKRKDIEPNKLTYQRMINRYCQQGDIDGASKILEFMREKGISVNENIFTALVRGHSEAGDMVSAADILTVMRQAGLQPSADTYKELLCGYAKHGDMESVTRTFSECQTNGVHLLDTDYLSVINSLASNGHSEHVDRILSIMPKEVSHAYDAMSYVLKFVHAGHIDVALKVLHSIPSREQGYIGGSVIKQLAQSNLPPEQLLAMCKVVHDKGINSRALIIGLEANLIQGNVDESLAFIEALKESNTEIREHYFWPILIALGRSNNNAGTYDVLQRMQADCTDCGGGISEETLREYVIPYQTGEPDQILSELLNIGVSSRKITSSMIYHLITQCKLKIAADLTVKSPFRYKTSLFCRPLIMALAETRDVDSFVKILQHIYQNRFSGKSKDIQETTANNRIIEPYLNDIITYVEDDNFETLSKVLEGLLAAGVNITDTGIVNLRRAVGNRSTPEIMKLIDRFRSKQPDYRSAASFDPWISQSEIIRLEKKLEESTQDSASSVAIKNSLFSLYSRVQDLPKLEQLVADFTNQGVEFTSTMYKQLIDTYLNSNVLGKIDEYLRILRHTYPGYTLSEAKYIKYITLLVKADRVDEALQFLQDKQNLQPRDSDNSKTFWWRLLSNLADTGSARAVNEAFEYLLQNEYIDISGPHLGPLVKVHIVREDLKEALSVFERICETYHLTPLKNELAKKLIATEDAAALQRLTDLSTRVHGEVNSLYDLVSSFIECDCLRQAKKILEIPALRSKIHRLEQTSKRYSEQGKTVYLEKLVAVVKDLPDFKAIPQFYEDLLHCYVEENNWERGFNLYKGIVEDEIEPSDKFLSTLADLLKKNHQPIPFIAPVVKIENFSQAEETQHSRSDKSSPNRGRSFRTTYANADGNDHEKSLFQTVSRAKSESKMIESLLKKKELNAAFEITESLLEKNMYPLHSTFRFMVKKFARAGEIELINKIGTHLTVHMKKSVNFENNLCDAYIKTGRAEEYLDLLERKYNVVDESNTSKMLSEFPVIGIAHLIEKHPELMEKLTKMAETQADQGITTPINALWIYHFLKGQPEADKIWSTYLVKRQDIMFHRIIRIAQKQNDTDLMKRLIKNLNESSVINDNVKGFAYSELCKLLYLTGKHQESIDVLREALRVVSVKNLPSHTLNELESHMATEGLTLPADISSEIEASKGRQRIAT